YTSYHTMHKLTPHLPSLSSTPPATSDISTLSLHDALPIWRGCANFTCVGFQLRGHSSLRPLGHPKPAFLASPQAVNQNEAKKARSEEHTSELQSRGHLVCRLLLEKKKKKNK